jgi:Protein of unknown function (DUF2630)
MSDQDIHQQIDDLVAEEHQLRSGAPLTPEQRARLQDLEVRLDRAWDLLRRRDGLRDKGENPDHAKSASADQVEGYLQ